MTGYGRLSSLAADNTTLAPCIERSATITGALDVLYSRYEHGSRAAAATDDLGARAERGMVE